MFNLFQRILICAVVALFTAQAALGGATPGLLSYQGRMTDASGNPLNIADQAITFRIWSDPGSSDPPFLKWEETQHVQVLNGLFDVILGLANPITDSVFSSSESYLGISIGSDLEGMPRTRLVSVGYSSRVETLNGSRGGVISGSVTLQPDDKKMATTSGPEFQITDNQSVILFSASDVRVFTPCIVFAGDSSSQCTAATNSGAAQAEDGSGSTDVGGSMTVLIEQTIDCPSAGYVLALGSCQASVNLSEGSQAKAEFGLSDSPSSLPSDQDKAWAVYREDDKTGTVTYSNVIAAQKLFSVSGGSSTFYLLGKKTSGSNPFIVTDKTLSLVFIPQAYGTVQSASASQTPNSGMTSNDDLAMLNSIVSQSASGVRVSLDVMPAKPANSPQNEIAELKRQIAEMQVAIQKLTNSR